MWHSLLERTGPHLEAGSPEPAAIDTNLRARTSRRMEVKRGIAVSPGVAIGPALVIDTEGIRITHRTVLPEQIPLEISRLGEALEKAASEARETRQRITALHGATIGNIFGAHESAFEATAFREQLESLIRAHSYSAEYAVSRFIRDYVKRLEDASQRVPEHGRAEARRRIAEFIDIEKQILVLLLGQNSEPLQELTEPVIVLATDLMPSDTADFSPRTVHAFATESGGNTSHTAILAGALEIPAVVGLGRFLSDVSGGDTVIVDGEEGVLIIDPDEATIARYEEKRAAILSRRPVRIPPRQAGRDARRSTRSLARQHRAVAGGVALPRSRRRRRRPLPHRIPLSEQDCRPDRGRALRSLQVGRSDPRARSPGRHPHTRPRRGQILERLRSRGR